MKRFSAAMIIIAGLGIWAPILSHAESAQGDIRSARDAALQKMFSDPADQDAMLTYARLSISLREFEPAVSTLERFLDLYPGDMSARTELGIAYFALGAYEVAALHFKQVLDSTGASADLKQRANSYQAEIEKRTAPSGFRGHVEAGIAASTNAALASDSAVIFAQGVATPRPAGAGPDADVGGTFSAKVEHRHDLGGPNGDFWFTEANIEAIHFFDDDVGNFDGLSVRTGPLLSVNELAFGPKIRPFFELDTVFLGNDWTYTTASLGAQYHNTFTAEWSMFASARAGFRWRDGTNTDGGIYRGIVGTTYRPTRDLRVRLSGIAELDDSQSAAIANLIYGARASAKLDFETGFSFADRKWAIEGYGQFLRRDFERANPAVLAGTVRKDNDLRLGAQLTAHLQDGFYVKASADWLARNSNISQFSGDEFLARISIGLEF